MASASINFFAKNTGGLNDNVFVGRFNKPYLQAVRSSNGRIVY
jgi:hypothetical protein